MYTVKTKIIGLKKAKFFVTSIPKETEEEVDKNVIPLCKPVEEEAKRLAPIKTGRLRSSITTEQPARLTGMVRDGVHYGIWQEIGFWHWRNPNLHIQNPFLIPALDIKFPEIIKNLAILVSEKIKRLKRQ